MKNLSKEYLYPKIGKNGINIVDTMNVTIANRAL